MMWGRKSSDLVPLIAARTGISVKRIRQLLRIRATDVGRLSAEETAEATKGHLQIQAALATINAELDRISSKRSKSRR